MTNAQQAAGNAASDSFDYQGYTPLVGQLVLLPATHIKPNQPLVNNETGLIEIVDKGKFFANENYSRYYIVSDETPTEKNLALWLEGQDAMICMYSDMEDKYQTDALAIYPAANSIVERIHSMYYDSIKEGKIEYMRFTKIHNGKYAGFPSRNRARITANEAKERWDYIFNHVLLTNPTNLKKKRIGVLFGTIAGADLTLKSVIELLHKYRSWIIS